MTRLAAAFETTHRRRTRPVVGGLLPDLARPRAVGSGRGRGPRGRRGRRGMSDAPERLGRADLHIHTLASDGTAGIEAILDHVERVTDLDVIAITDHERIDAALAARTIAADRGLRCGGRRRRGGDDARRAPAGALRRRADPALSSLRWTIEAVHDQGGLAIPAHPLVPYPLCAQGWVLRRLLADHDPAAHPDGLETFNPTSLRQAPAPPRSSDSRTSTASPDSATATPTRSTRRERLDHVPRHGRRRPAGERSRPARPPPRRRLPRDGRATRHVRAAAPQAQPRRPRRGRRPGPSRRHRPRPRLPGRHAASAAVRRGVGCPREDRPRLAVRLPAPRRRHPARPLPLREPAAARPRRPDHHLVPRPPALVRGRRHPPRQGLHDAGQRLGRDDHPLAALPLAGPRDARARALRRPPLPRAVRAVPVARPPARVAERERRDVPRLRRLVAGVRVRQPGRCAATRRGSTGASRSARRRAISSTATSRATTR